MPYVDYREINPETAIELTREYARDEYIDALDMCDTLLGEDTFIRRYVDDYMDGVTPGEDVLHAAQARMNALSERRRELLNSIQVVISGPCAMAGDELSPSARHDVNYYRAQLTEVETQLWDAIDDIQAIETPRSMFGMPRALRGI